MHMLAALAFFAAVAPALAQGFGTVPPVADDAARRECGACHLAYQPQLLPVEAWQRVFAGLGGHFGTSVSLDPAVQRQILDHYLAHAGPSAGSAVPTRITETAWWLRAHRKVRAATWAKPEVAFKGNCSACHPRAEQGIYQDR